MPIAASCDRTLDLEHKYDNSESKLPYSDDSKDTLTYTETDTYKISQKLEIYVPEGVPRKGYWLDGKITVGKFFNSDYFTTIWSSDVSLIQNNCSSPWLEDNISSLTAQMEVFGNTIDPIDGFTDGGSWFIGVHPLSNGNMVGFFHAESHWKGSWSAYKSIGVTYSTDKGKTWEPGTKILSGPDPKPETSRNEGESYGLGDGCVVWNDSRQSWICYYCGFCPAEGDFMISMAESTDPEGRPGTWKKWDGNAFSGEGCDQSSGLGSINVSIAGLSSRHGGNTSVSWNTKLNCWLMTYHEWTRTIVLSMSTDGIEWTQPITIIDSTMEPDGCMYPNIITSDGDLTSGEEMRIYYSAGMNLPLRTLAYRYLILK